MTLYGFSREDIARQLSHLAKKDLIANYPDSATTPPGLAEFSQGRQTGVDPELYLFRNGPDEIPAAHSEIDPDASAGDIIIQAGVTQTPQAIYKPSIRPDPNNDPSDPNYDPNVPNPDYNVLGQDVDFRRIHTFEDMANNSTYGTATAFVYNPWDKPIPANTVGVCAVVGGILVALQKPPTRRIRFRLVTNFNDQGWALADVQDSWGDPNICWGASGQTEKVYDPRKLFAHARGYNDTQIAGLEATAPLPTDMFNKGGSVGYAIETWDCAAGESFNCNVDCGPDSHCYPRFEVEQCTQTANKLLVRIDGHATGRNNAFPKGTDSPGMLSPPEELNLKVDPDECLISDWPYVDFPTEVRLDQQSGEIRVEKVYNPHRFTACDGWATIERVNYPSRFQNSTNRCVPYTPSQYTRHHEWHIVDVQKPIARYICVTYNVSGSGSELEKSWSYGSVFFEGTDPTCYFSGEGDSIDDHIETAPCLYVDCLKNGSSGVAFWDPNAQKYYVFSTDSALYGRAKNYEIIGKNQDNPENVTLIEYGEECALNYKVLQYIKAFGDNDPGCPTTYSNRVTNPNLKSVDVLTDVTRSYVCEIDGSVDPSITDESACTAAGGTWKLSEEICFDKKVVFVCDDEDTEDVCVNVCCDDEPTPPSPDYCFECEHCFESEVKFQNFVLVWSNVDDGTGQVFGGRATNAVFEELAFSDGCCARLTCTLESDNPAIAPQTVTATVCIEIAGAGFCNLSTLKVTFAWSQANYAGVTLPTEMCGGLLNGCVGDYGLSGGAGVNPNNPSPTGGTWDEAGIAVVGC